MGPCVQALHVQTCVCNSCTYNPCMCNPCVCNPLRVQPCACNPCVCNPYACNPCVCNPCARNPCVQPCACNPVRATPAFATPVCATPVCATPARAHACAGQHQPDSHACVTRVHARGCTHSKPHVGHPSPPPSPLRRPHRHGGTRPQGPSSVGVMDLPAAGARGWRCWVGHAARRCVVSGSQPRRPGAKFLRPHRKPSARSALALRRGQAGPEGMPE